MKKYAVIRLVIYSVIALALTGVLIAGMTLDIFSGISGFSLGTSYDESDYSIYNGPLSFTSAEVNSLDVNWIQGEVIIESDYATDSVSVSESSLKSTDEDDALRYTLSKNGTLKIQFAKSHGFFGLIGSKPEKTLTIKLPTQVYKKISADTASANVSAKGFETEKLNIAAVSGNVGITSVSADDADIDVVSGNVRAVDSKLNSFNLDSVSGALNCQKSFIEKLNVDTVSGDISVESYQNIKELSCETVSGDLELAIPENSGFVCDVDSVSGDFNSDFAVIKKDGKYYCGDESGDFDIESASGDVTVNKIITAPVSTTIGQ